MIRASLLGLLLMLSAAGADALTADEQLSDPALEARARVIAKDLRCPVCQNESIDESNAVVARDLRRLVRERLVEGDSNAEVIDYVHARYGDYVLLKPPLKPETYLLYAAPALALLIALFAARGAIRRRREVHAEAAPLSAEDEARVDALLAAEGEPPRR